MNICILVPSKEYIAQAGVRIRYRRIERSLQERGHTLELATLHDLAASSRLLHDVYVISKCYEASSFLFARLAVNAGKLVGLDLFDDYFSQIDDSRLGRLRYWLRTLLPLVDFALCSTGVMQDVIARIAPTLPVHLLRDPAEPVQPESLVSILQRKLQDAQQAGNLTVTWFGIGDNPYFTVGLADLAAYSEELAKLRGRGFNVQLNILTNAPAVKEDRLAMLRRLAVPYVIEEWTEEREKELIARSLLCFLPVNAQPFSVAKSLNRATSALCGGAQVLSAGYPLYERFAPFVYRDAKKFLDDLTCQRLALRPDTVPSLMRLLQQDADPAAEAESLIEFLEGQFQRTSRSSVMRNQVFAIIHGRHAAPDVHKFAQQAGALSVASPICSAKLQFDVRFVLPSTGNNCHIFLSARGCSMLDANIRAWLSPQGKFLEAEYYRVDLERALPGFEWSGLALARLGSQMSVTASYPWLMASVKRALDRLFPNVTCYYSERAELPWMVFTEGAPATGGVA